MGPHGPLGDTMWLLGWIGVAFGAETDCVTKDLTWRWLSTGDADRWVHGSTVLVDKTSPRMTWKADEATKVPFKSGGVVETFKWDVTLTASDGKPIGGGVTEATVKLTMHCQRTDGQHTPAAKPAAAAGAAAAPKSGAAAKVAPAPAPAPAAPAPAAPAPAPKP